MDFRSADDTLYRSACNTGKGSIPKCLEPPVKDGLAVCPSRQVATCMAWRSSSPNGRRSRRQTGHSIKNRSSSSDPIESCVSKVCICDGADEGILRDPTDGLDEDKAGSSAARVKTIGTHGSQTRCNRGYSKPSSLPFEKGFATTRS